MNNCQATLRTYERTKWLRRKECILFYDYTLIINILLCVQTSRDFQITISHRISYPHLFTTTNIRPAKKLLKLCCLYYISSSQYTKLTAAIDLWSDRVSMQNKISFQLCSSLRIDMHCSKIDLQNILVHMCILYAPYTQPPAKISAFFQIHCNKKSQVHTLDGILHMKRRWR